MDTRIRIPDIERALHALGDLLAARSERFGIAYVRGARG
jgi:hypothetical protein